MKLIIDPSKGTRVLGSKFGYLETSDRQEQFDHSVSTKLNYRANWWLVARVDDGVIDYYADQVYRKFGVKLHSRTLWGAHVSVIRGVRPQANVKKWGAGEGKIAQIKYTHDIHTNGKHWWLNVESDDLVNVRAQFGFSTDKKRFHLTIGRIS